MEFRLLGRLEVAGGDRLLDVGSTKQRAVLAMLLVHLNRVIDTDDLTTWLWADSPPSRSANVLQTYVSRLRRVLADAGTGEGCPELLGRPGGYLLRADPNDLDIRRFEELAAHARQRLQAGNYEAGSVILRQALALWRGPALADFADWNFAVGEAARLEDLRLAVTEDLFEAELALGHHNALIADLETFVGIHPLRERPWGQLMVALYRSGRQVEALRTYQALRRMLVDQLGIEPAPALRLLEFQILHQKSELDWVPRVAPALLTVSYAELDVPLPAFLTDLGRVLVGRERELHHLRLLWEQAVVGPQRVVLVGGEPGVGKTRLVAEVARWAHAEQAIVLAGRCDEDVGLAYQPFVEALRYFIDHAAGLGTLLGRHAGELVRLVPELAERLPGLPPPLRSDPEMERHRLFDAVASWLAITSAVRPLVLVLDDLQWAVTPTLQLLRHLIRSPETMRMLVLCAYRDTDLGRRHPLTDLLTELRRDERVERFPLLGLDQAGVARFIEGAAGHPLDEEEHRLARALHSETEGNPFFVGEVLRHLAETGVVARRRGRWCTQVPLEEIGIPQGVREVVGRRLSRLSDEANGVLRTAAVIGAEVELSLLRAASPTGIEEEALLGALEETTEAHLVIEAPGREPCYRFAHALVRHTLYDDLSAARRLTAHQRVAEAIERVHAATLDTYERAVLLASHWQRAGDFLQAALWNERAAGFVLRTDMSEAIRRFQATLEQLASTPETDEALRIGIRTRTRLIRFGARTGMDPTETERLYSESRTQAERLKDATQLASVIFAYGTTNFWRGVVREGHDRWVEAAHLADQTDDVDAQAGYWTIAAAGAAWVGRLNVGFQAVQRAQTLCGENLSAGSSVLGYSALAVLGLARAELLAIEGRLDEARTALDAGQAVARARGESEFIAWTLTIYARLARTRGQFRASLRSAHEAARLAEESGNASNHVLALGAVGIAEIGLGRFREAIECLEQALAEARRHQTGLFEEARLLKDLARARLSLGDYPGARSDASDAVEVARRQGAPTLECLGLLTRARACRASDAVKEFETDLAAALAVAEAAGATAYIQEIKSEQRRVRG